MGGVVAVCISSCLGGTKAIETGVLGATGAGVQTVGWAIGLELCLGAVSDVAGVGLCVCIAILEFQDRDFDPFDLRKGLRDENIDVVRDLGVDVGVFAVALAAPNSP